ncbi:MAG: ABC transporter permease [Pseudomonadales bacterium]
MRTSWQITRSVWHAMFMREVLARTMANRFAWFWMLAEPVLLVVIMIWVRDLLGRMRFVIGAEFVPWLIVGLVSFFLFREGVMRSMGAINANQALFAYRQVLPVDPVLVRNVLEGLIKTLVFFILVGGAALLGYHMVPGDPLAVLGVWLSLWLLGLGVGLVVSVGATLINGVEAAVRLAMLPLLLLSGVIIPLHMLPHSVQQYLLYNPILHALESIRLGFFDGYKAMAGVDMGYVWLWILPLLALGLALHLRFVTRLKAQ